MRIAHISAKGMDHLVAPVKLAGTDYLLSLKAVGESAPGLKELLASGRSLIELNSLVLAEAEKLVDCQQREKAIKAELLLAHGDATFLPPVAEPGKLLVVGPNHKRALPEKPRYPYAFFKFPSTMVGQQGDILIPPQSPLIDYFGSFAAVIGRKAHNINATEAMSVIAGYILLAEASRRDFGFNPKERGSVLLSKSTDASTPVGPWFVSADEIPDPSVIDVEYSRTSGEISTFNASELWFGIEEIVSFASSLELHAGDIIGAGSDTDAGLVPAPGNWLPLRAGDYPFTRSNALGLLNSNVRA